MKRYVLVLLLLLSPLSIAHAVSINFSWIANPVEEKVTGYKIYQDCGSSECIVINALGADTTSATLELVNPRERHTYSLAAYRVDTMEDGTEEVMESAHSNYIIYDRKRIVLTTPKFNAVITR